MSMQGGGTPGHLPQLWSQYPNRYFSAHCTHSPYPHFRTPARISRASRGLGSATIPRGLVRYMMSKRGSLGSDARWKCPPCPRWPVDRRCRPPLAGCRCREAVPLDTVHMSDRSTPSSTSHCTAPPPLPSRSAIRRRFSKMRKSLSYVRQVCMSGGRFACVLFACVSVPVSGCLRKCVCACARARTCVSCWGGSNKRKKATRFEGAVSGIEQLMQAHLAPDNALHLTAVTTRWFLIRTCAGPPGHRRNWCRAAPHGRRRDPGRSRCTDGRVAGPARLHAEAPHPGLFALLAPRSNQ